MDLRTVIQREAGRVAPEPCSYHASRDGLVTAIGTLSRRTTRIGSLHRVGRGWHAWVQPMAGYIGRFERQSDAIRAIAAFVRQGEFDWGKLTYGEFEVPTDAVWALRQHDDLNSGKHPHLFEDVREHGITEPLEVSLHDDERGAVLRGGSHRVNIAHALGVPTVRVRVIDMRAA